MTALTYSHISAHKPTLQDLKLVGDILFTETPTLKYSAEEQKELIALGTYNPGGISLKATAIFLV